MYIQVIVTNQITTRFGRQATEQGEFLKGIIILLLLLSLLSKLAEVTFCLHCRYSCQYFISNFLWFTSKMRRRPQKSQTAMWLSLLVTRGVIMSTLAWFSSIWSERKDKWVLSFNSFLGTQIFYYNWKIQNNKNTLHDVRYFFKFFSMHFSWKLLMQLNFFFLQFFA